jgi:hypothetical protein
MDSSAQAVHLAPRRPNPLPAKIGEEGEGVYRSRREETSLRQVDHAGCPDGFFCAASPSPIPEKLSPGRCRIIAAFPAARAEARITAN